MEISSIDELETLAMVQAGMDLWQNRFHRHDVYQHTIEVVKILKQLNASPELVAAGWLHDVGKPPTKVPKEDRHPNDQPYHSFPDHEKKGEEMVRALPQSIFKNLNVDQDRVARIVGYHFMPMGRVKAMKDEPTFEFFREQVSMLSDELDETEMRNEILTIFYADKASQKSDDLKFLLGLREYLLHQKGDLQALFDKFISAYRLQ